MVVAINMEKVSSFRHKDSYSLGPHKEWGDMYLHLSEQKHTKAFVCLIIPHVTQLITCKIATKKNVVMILLLVLVHNDMKDNKEQNSMF